MSSVFFKKQIACTLALSMLGVSSSICTDEQITAPADVSTETPVSISSDNTSLYKNSVFSMKVPKGWITDESGTFGTSVIFLSGKLDKNSFDNFKTNINVISEATQGLDFTHYVATTKELLPQLLQDYTTEEDENLTINTLPAILIKGSFTQGTLKLKNVQLITIKDNTAYIITGTVLQENWEEVKDAIITSLKTFTIT